MKISEIFYSVQAEGVTNGVPAVFIRMAGCNLRCGVPLLKNIKGKTQEELEEAKDESASWVCDTISVWTQSKEMSNSDVISFLEHEDLLRDVAEGTVHIVFTGGEPTLKAHVEAIKSFINEFKKFIQDNFRFPADPYVELETNGTVEVDEVFYKRYIDQINCSPKLSNSGHEWRDRVNARALKQINHSGKAWFKFVISDLSDILEIYNDFIHFIDMDRVILMPALVDQNLYHEKQLMIYEMAKEFRLRAVNRNHISAWNKKTGV